MTQRTIRNLHTAT